MSRELEFLLRRIHEALEEYIYPGCRKCHSKITRRTCDCEEKKSKNVPEVESESK